MAIIQGFTRRETLDLTATTSNRLQYLERCQLVVPQRISKSRRPTVIYTWEQVLEIRAIKNLREVISLQTVRKIIKFLDESGFDDSLRDKQLVVIDEEVIWVQQDWKDFADQLPSVLKVAGHKNKDVGQYLLVVIPPLYQIVNEVWLAAEKSTVVHFESFKQRAKAKPIKIA